MYGGSWVFILPMVATSVLGAIGGWLTAYLNFRTQTRNSSRDGEWKIIAWQEKELDRLRKVEEAARKCEEEHSKLEAKLAQAEAARAPTPLPPASA